MSLKKGSNGKGMYGVMTDPTAQQEGDAEMNYSLPSASEASRRSIRRRCAVATLFLAAMFLSTYSMFSGMNCQLGSHTTSGVPFRLVHEVPGRYGCSMLLATFATVTSLFYPIAVARKPRPHFLHVAGCYLMVNAVTMCSEVTTVWAGCKDVEWVRAPTAFTSMVGLAASFVLLQYSILVKVEAMDVDAQEEELAKAPLRKAYHMMLNPFTIGFGVLSSVVPLGIVDEYGWLYFCIVFVQAFFLIIFLGVMVSFTAIAVREMREVLVELDHSDLDRRKKAKLRNHLAMHSVAALGANMTTMVFFASIAGVVLSKGKVVTDAFMFFAYGLDILANTTCALTLSGLCGAVCRKGGGVALLEENGAGESVVPKGAVAGPVENLEAAGRAALKYQEEEQATLQEESEEAE